MAHFARPTGPATESESRRRKTRNKDPAPSERGFTLIELSVVVLVIAILLAVSIPTFLGARKNAQDGQAQQLIANSIDVAKRIYSDTESYAGLSLTQFTSNTVSPYDGNPHLAVWSCGSPTCDVNGVGTNTANVVAVLSWSGTSGGDSATTFAVTASDGNCWFATVHSTEPTDYGVIRGYQCGTGQAGVNTCWTEPGATPGTTGTFADLCGLAKGTPVAQLNTFPSG